MKQVEQYNHLRQHNHVRKIVQAGLLVAIAIIVRNFSYMLYFSGATGMRIGFAGVFTRMAAILFGPLYGGAVSGIVDVIGYILKPEGAYIPMLTATAIIGGILAGLIWRNLDEINTEKLCSALVWVFAIVGASGIANHVFLLMAPEAQWSRFLSTFEQYVDFATFGLEIVSLCGLMLIGINELIKKINKNPAITDVYLKVVLATGIPGMVVTVANTFILRIFIPQLARRAFLVFLLPRVVEEISMVVLQSYVISILLHVCRVYVSERTGMTRK